MKMFHAHRQMVRLGEVNALQVLARTAGSVCKSLKMYCTVRAGWAALIGINGSTVFGFTFYVFHLSSFAVMSVEIQITPTNLTPIQNSSVIENVIPHWFPTWQQKLYWVVLWDFSDYYALDTSQS